MQSKIIGKYELRELHQEIDLLDRKITYCQTLEKFDTEEARASALQKLQNRRELLAKRAVDAVNKGIEYDAKDLPRSFRDKETVSPEG
jgi:hypothetical protein